MKIPKLQTAFLPLIYNRELNMATSLPIDRTYNVRFPYNINVTKKRTHFASKSPRTSRRALNVLPYYINAGDLVTAAIGPLNVASPGQHIGAIRDANLQRKDENTTWVGNYFRSLMRGNSGWVTPEYAKEHPLASLALNVGGDALTLGGPKAVLYLTKMDMPRYGFKPTTKYYFEPGYAGMNGGSPIVRQTGRMRTINSILLELRLRFGREATPQEIQLFINNNPGLQLGTIEHPIRGRQTVITGSLDAFNNAETNLTRILQEGKSSNILSGVDNDDMYEIQKFLSRPTTGLPIRTRSAKEVRLLGRYTEGDLKLPNGSPNPNLRPSWLITGAHGEFIYPTSSPSKVASNLLLLVNNPSIGRKEVFEILRDNPRGRSGVLIHTHKGDLGVDSHPLSHSVLEMQGFERIIPTRGDSFEGRVVANPYGYKNLFVDSKLWELEPSLQRYISSDSLNIKLGKNNPYYATKETDGSLIIYETSSNKAVGRIPAREAEDVLENAFNAPIRATNRHFGIDLPKAIIGRSGGDNAQWTFGREIEYPSFGGFWGSLGLKKGGKLIK